MLLRFLHDVERDNLFVNFDPANMILYGVRRTDRRRCERSASYVRSIHCKDATWSDQPGRNVGPRSAARARATSTSSVPAHAAEIGYDGPLTIEREIPQEPERQKAEIASASASGTSAQEVLRTYR